MTRYVLPVALAASTLFAACGDTDDELCPAAEARAAYPAGPYGVADNAVIDNHSFTTTAGEVDFQSVRADEGARLLLVSTAAGWCGSCAEEQPILQQLYDTYNEQGLTVLVSVFEDSDGNPATPAYVDEWINRYSLTFPVVADEPFVLSAYYNIDLTPMNMIIDLNTMEIVFNRTGFDQGAVEAVIQATIGGC